MSWQVSFLFKKKFKSVYATVFRYLVMTEPRLTILDLRVFDQEQTLSCTLNVARQTGKFYLHTKHKDKQLIQYIKRQGNDDHILVFLCTSSYFAFVST